MVVSKFTALNFGRLVSCRKFRTCCFVNFGRFQIYHRTHTHTHEAVGHPHDACHAARYRPSLHSLRPGYRQKYVDALLLGALLRGNTSALAAADRHRLLGASASAFLKTRARVVARAMVFSLGACLSSDQRAAACETLLLLLICLVEEILKRKNAKRASILRVL